MRVFLTVFIFFIFCSVSHAKELFIRVDANDMIIDVATEQENISPGRAGQVIKINTQVMPIFGDHYVNDEVVQDSVKRTEAVQERQKREDDTASLITKLKGLGLTDDEISIIIGRTITP